MEISDGFSGFGLVRKKKSIFVGNREYPELEKKRKKRRKYRVCLRSRYEI